MTDTNANGATEPTTLERLTARRDETVSEIERITGEIGDLHVLIVKLAHMAGQLDLAISMHVKDDADVDAMAKSMNES